MNTLSRFFLPSAPAPQRFAFERFEDVGQQSPSPTSSDTRNSTMMKKTATRSLWVVFLLVSIATAVAAFKCPLVEEKVVLRLLRSLDDCCNIERRDYAQAASGGRVVPQLTSNFETGRWADMWARLSYVVGVPSSISNPATVIRDDNRFGDCWEFAGDKAHVGIVLSLDSVIITHVSVEHKRYSGIEMAPREMLIWGVLEAVAEGDLERLRQGLPSNLAGFNASVLHAELSLGDRALIPLANFQYNKDSVDILQRFEVWDGLSRGGIKLGAIMVDVLSNWGGVSTCLYRVQIHGRQAV